MLLIESISEILAKIGFYFQDRLEAEIHGNRAVANTLSFSKKEVLWRREGYAFQYNTFAKKCANISLNINYIFKKFWLLSSKHKIDLVLIYFLW